MRIYLLDWFDSLDLKKKQLLSNKREKIFIKSVNKRRIWVKLLATTEVHFKLYTHLIIFFLIELYSLPAYPWESHEKDWRFSLNVVNVRVCIIGYWFEDKNSYQMEIVPGLGMGACIYFPSQHWNFMGLELCRLCVHTATVSVSSYMSQPCCD